MELKRIRHKTYAKNCIFISTRLKNRYLYHYFYLLMFYSVDNQIYPKEEKKENHCRC